MMRAFQIISKIYPVVHSEGFKFSEATPWESAVHNVELYKLREKLVKSALRHGVKGVKEKVSEPLENLTKFKPFTVRELEFDTADDHFAR
jgi:hypothetical protein